MADTQAQHVTDHDLAKNLGALLATQRGDPPREEGVGEEEGPEEVAEATDSLGDHAEEEEAGSGETDEDEQVEADAEETEFSLPIKYKGTDYRITDRGEATRLAQLGRHFEERQDEIVRREQAAEQIGTEADQLRSRYQAGLQEVVQFFEQVAGDPPKEADFDDRAQYLEAVNQHAQMQQAVGAYRSELQRAQAEQVETQQQQLRKWAAKQEEDTLAAVPEWHDPAVRQADVKAMSEYAETVGMPPEAAQFPQLVNAKWFRVMLRDASRYRSAAEAGTAEVEKSKTKEAAPGSGNETRTGHAGRARRELTERLKKSGKVDDAAAIGSQLMQRQRQLTRKAER